MKSPPNLKRRHVRIRALRAAKRIEILTHRRCAHCSGPMPMDSLARLYCGDDCGSLARRARNGNRPRCKPSKYCNTCFGLAHRRDAVCSECGGGYHEEAARDLSEFARTESNLARAERIALGTVGLGIVR